MLPYDAHRVVAEERRPALRHLVEHGPQGVEVRLEEHFRWESALVRRILNLEGPRSLARSATSTSSALSNWIPFVGLPLAPHIGLTAYMSRNDRIGSIFYDAFHRYVLSVAPLSLEWRLAAKS